MIDEHLLTELHKLDRTQKLRVVQLLVNELASDDALLAELFPVGATYEIWSPFDSGAAAQQLMKLLDETPPTDE